MAKRGPKGPSKYTDEVIERYADELEVWMSHDCNIFFKQFAHEKGFSSQRLSEFAKQNEKFSESLKKAKDIQEWRIAEGAIKGEFNPAMSIFALKNVAGWRDKKDVDHTSGGKPMPILNALSSNNSNKEDSKTQEED